jgi:hypothetical protein
MKSKLYIKIVVLEDFYNLNQVFLKHIVFYCNPFTEYLNKNYGQVQRTNA